MSSARSFLSHLVDYAGLFPPAQLDMTGAVNNYASYIAGLDHDLLGRFILPADRLDEFAAAAREPLLEATDGKPWQLSVVAKGDLSAVNTKLLEFNCRHWRGSADGHAEVNAVEVAVSTPEDVTAVAACFPHFFDVYLEVPFLPNADSLIEAIARTGARGKIRTGGTLAGAFPAASQIARLLSAFRHHRVTFKATAGLHHAIRGDYPLTYEPASETAKMFGYLNLFLAAASIWAGHPEQTAIDILNTSDIKSFQLTDQGASWKGLELSAADLDATRRDFAVSFGSCSFDEPVAEARALGLI